MATSVFIVPGSRVKNGADRLVVLNTVAASVIGRRRGLHDTTSLRIVMRRAIAC